MTEMPLIMYFHRQKDFGVLPFQKGHQVVAIHKDGTNRTNSKLI